MKAEAEHKKAFAAFKTQYDAAVGGRNKVVALQGDANYPWEQDSLANALTQWDPYFNAVASWVTADGEDAGVATTDQLNDWALYQGVELYSETTNEETGEVTSTRLEYQVVRGYQNAANYVIAANKAITDMNAAIAAAISTRDDDMNSQGDKVTFQKAIDGAQAVVDGVKANTTDTKRADDEATLASAQAALATAQDTFIESGKLTPIVSIDFSNGFTEVKDAETEEVTGYYIAGAAGQMDFAAGTVDFAGLNENGTEVTHTNANGFQLGHTTTDATVLGDVLRVGNYSATVTIPEELGDEDVLRVQFDMWFGNLITKYAGVELQNAAGERVAGFYMSKYDNAVSYNDFNNAENTGMDLLAYVTGIGSSAAGNDAICADNNKSSFDLIVDYKAKAVKGTLTNPQKGTCEGELIPMQSLDDTKVAKFVLKSNYNNDGRRCWFDNLVMYKYASTAEGPISTGIEKVATANTAAGIYSITGQKLTKAPAKGLYIMNGKKYIVK